jgi:hypothetical protein
MDFVFISFFLFSKSFFGADVSGKILSINLHKFGINIYFPEELSPVAQEFASKINEENEFIKELIGTEAKNFSIFLGFEEDVFFFERFFTHSKLIFVNWGGTRIDEKLSSVSFSHKVRQVLLASFFGSGSPLSYIIEPDFYLKPQLIYSFSEYGVIDDKTFSNYPFYFFWSEDAQLIKYIDIFYGKKKIFELFVKGKIESEYRDKYYQEFKVWKENKIEVLKDAIERKYGINPSFEKIFNFPSRSVFVRGDEIITTREDGIIFSSKVGDIFIRSRGGYINGDERFIVFDSKEKTDGLFYIFIITPSYKVIKFPEKRAWFPDIFSREDGKGFILFIKKNLIYDEICIADFIFEGDNLQFGEISCPLKSRELEEFFSPDISPDGKKVVFSYLRRNGFLDLAVFDIETKTLQFITQDDNQDLFPSFTQDGKIVFTSFREGRYLLYLYDGEKFTKISENPEGILAGRIYNQKLYSVFIQNGKTYVGESEVKELEGATFTRAPVVSFGSEFESSKVETFGNFGIFRLFFPRFFVDSSGFFNFSIYFLLSDDIYRNPIFFNLDFGSNINLFEQMRELKLQRYEISNVDDLKTGGLIRAFGFSIFSFVRSFSPYMFARFSLFPFSGIFVREVAEGENKQRFHFIPERQVSGDVYFFQKGTRKLWILVGGKFGNISPYEEFLQTPDTTFWNFVKEEYKRFGYGNFFQVESGIWVDTTQKDFSPQDGFDIRLFLGLQSFFDFGKGQVPLSPYSNFSLSYFSHSFNFFSFPVVGQLNLNGFVSFPKYKRFKTAFGSKPIPFYFDPADNFSPLWKFGALPFFPENLKYDVGLIRGVRIRDGDIGFVAKMSPILNLFSARGEPKYIYHSDYINLSPFISGGVLRNFKELEGFISYGLELKIKSKIFFIIPSDFVLGFAIGEIPEFYFLLFLSP